MYIHIFLFNYSENIIIMVNSVFECVFDKPILMFENYFQLIKISYITLEVNIYLFMYQYGTI